MDIIYAIILGIIQGLTEFLPVSSTGHLILAQNIFHLSTDQFGLTFDVALHIGTALAVLVYFWQTWWRLLSKAVRKGATQAESIDRRILLTLIIGTVPAGVFGLLFEKVIEDAFRSPLVIAVALIFGSAIFYVAERIGSARKSIEMMTPADGFLIGCSQAVALIPGISRSGITISAGLLRNFDRETAARFAFLLSTPVIFGAGLKKLIDITILNSVSVDWTIFAVGTITSLITGFITIVYFLRYMKNHSLAAFIWYRVILAMVIIVLIFFGKLV